MKSCEQLGMTKNKYDRGLNLGLLAYQFESRISRQLVGQEIDLNAFQKLFHTVLSYILGHQFININ